MLELYRIPEPSNVDPASICRIPYWVSLIGRPLFWTVVLMTLVALALELGAHRKEFKIAGPFASETNPARHSLILAVPQEGRAAWWRQPLLADDSGKASRSFLELWIDGREMGPPHTLHETIREGTTTGFSHWGRYVIFSLPPGVKNDSETIATLRYSVRPRRWVSFTLIFLSALLGWLLNANAVRLLARRYEGRLAGAVLRAPYLILFGFCGVGVTASAVYAASSLYAFAKGWALPTTALIRWSSIAAWAARNEPYLGYLLLMLAGLGTATMWLIGSSALRQPLVELNEQSLRRLLAWCGFRSPPALLFFVSAQCGQAWSDRAISITQILGGSFHSATRFITLPAPMIRRETALGSRSPRKMALGSRSHSDDLWRRLHELSFSFSATIHFQSC